jgi:hypothetical protein
VEGHPYFGGVGAEDLCQLGARPDLKVRLRALVVLHHDLDHALAAAGVIAAAVVVVRDKQGRAREPPETNPER